MILFNIILQATFGGLYGVLTPQQFLLCMFFAGIGAFLSLNLEANKRNVDSDTSPKKFKYRVLIEQNALRIIWNIVAVYVMLRFFKEISGKDINEFMAFVVGFGIDRIPLYLKRLKEQMNPKK